MLPRQITEHIHMYWEKNPQLLIRASGSLCPLGAANGGAQLAPSVEQTTMTACFPLCLLLFRFTLFQLHRLTPQTALPHLCNWNFSSHQLDTLWPSQSKCQRGEVTYADWSEMIVNLDPYLQVLRMV